MVQYKRCSNPNCKQVNPQSLENFYNDKNTKDGKVSKCKHCIREWQKAYWKTPKGQEVKRQACRKYRNSEKGRQKEVLRKQTEQGRESVRRAKTRYATSEKNKAAQLRYITTEKGKQYAKVAYERLKTERANVFMARRSVKNAVRRGDLPPVITLPCKDCGNPAYDYHHHSYEPEYWLDVVPLCRRCHRNLHSET